MKSSTLLLLYGLQATAFASAATGKSNKGANAELPLTDITSETLAGTNLVEAALAELRTLPRSPRKTSTSTTGIAGRIAHFLFGNIFSGPARGPEHQQRNEIVTGALATAVQRLEEAVQQGNTEAIYLLAELNFYGYYGHPRNLHDAFRYYQTLASEHGNSSAQHMLGVYHSTGLGDVVPQDQAKALLYYNFAAITGNPRSEMALGYRYDAGIGAIKSCETAAKHYKSVADKVMDWYRSGPPDGRNWVQEAWHISEEDGGVYGEGASASSSGSNAALKASGTMESDAKIADIIEYLDLMSQKGDSKATASLGRMYYNGQRGLPTNYELARKYFRTVSLRYWKSDLQSKDVKQPIDRVAASVAGYIGKMHLRGEGVPQNFEKAKLWFERGQTYGDPMSQHLRGLMELHGYGVDRNIKMAVALFRSAADQNYGPARVQLGRLLLEQGDEQDIRLARTHFEEAVAMYSNIEALYFLGEMSLHGIGKDKTCAQAVRYYKFVVERAEPFLSSWSEASRAYEAGANDLAYLHFLLAAEQGYEYAQSNVAYLLDTERDSKSLFSLFQEHRPSSNLLSNPREALIYWTRSSRQSNVDATVKMGDYYFHGIGAKTDVKKAVQCYTGASEHSQSAQAMYNLGWMHENGIGLDQDFHLAKRYYDMALEVNKEAYLPVTLSLLKLRLRSAWNTVTNGPIHSIRDDPKPRKDWSLSEWFNNFLSEDLTFAEEELYDDMYDDTIGLDDFVDDDEGVLESFLIIGITMSLMFLLWWRQRVQAQNQAGNNGNPGQAEQNNQQHGQPPPGAAPADGFPGWAAGGFGI